MAFAPHIFPITIGRDLILFDTLGDRYVALPGGIDDTSVSESSTMRPVEATLLPGAWTTLRSANFLVDDAFPPKPRIATPTRQIRIDWNETPDVTLTDATDLLIAMGWTALRLRKGLQCRRFASARTSSGPIDDVAPNLMTELRHLRDIRLFIPTPRRCLPAASIAARFLERRGIHVDIVFGVRSHPFEAHCWIEHDGVVLDDRLDKVLAYVPIAIGAL